MEIFASVLRLMIIIAALIGTHGDIVINPVPDDAVIESVTQFTYYDYYYGYSINCDERDDLSDASVANTVLTGDYTKNEGSFGARYTCGELLVPGYIESAFSGPQITPSTFRIGISTMRRGFKAERGSPTHETLRDCCGATHCPGCFQSSPKCALRIWVLPSSESIRQPSLRWKGYCRLCYQIDCRNTCRNGEYASEYLSRSQYNGLINSDVSCAQCLAGTFNTCVVKGSCTW